MLILDEDDVILDSDVIVEYLDEFTSVLLASLNPLALRCRSVFERHHRASVVAVLWMTGRPVRPQPLAPSAWPPDLAHQGVRR